MPTHHLPTLPNPPPIHSHLKISLQKTEDPIIPKNGLDFQPLEERVDWVVD